MTTCLQSIAPMQEGNPHICSNPLATSSYSAGDSGTVMYLCFIVSQIAAQSSGIILEPVVTPTLNWLARDEYVSPVAGNLKKKNKQCIVFCQN